MAYNDPFRSATGAPIPLPPAPPTLDRLPDRQRPTIRPAVPSPPDPFAAKRQRDQAEGDRIRAIRMQRLQQHGGGVDARMRLGNKLDQKLGGVPPAPPPVDPRAAAQRMALERMPDTRPM